MTTTSATVTVPEPGLYYDIPFDQYASWPLLNPSIAKNATESLRNYHYRLTHPKQQTPQMALGSAEHVSCLEPDEFARRYVLWTGGRRAGKVYDEFCYANADKAVLSDDDYSKCIAMRKAIQSHALAGEYLFRSSAETEVSIVWCCPETGRKHKGRIDWLRSDLFIDLKCVRSIDPRELGKQAVEWGWHISMAAYQIGIETQIGKRLPAKLICVENHEPFDVAVVGLDEEVMKCGRNRWAELVAAITDAEQTGSWPGIAEHEEMPLVLPAWELERDGDLQLTMNGLAL